MRKICKIKFSQIKLKKNNLVSENKKQTQKKKEETEKKMKMTAMSEGSQLRRLIHFFQSFGRHLTVPYSQIWLTIENQVGGV